jgi:hypothetical protein
MSTSELRPDRIGQQLKESVASQHLGCPESLVNLSFTSPFIMIAIFATISLTTLGQPQVQARLSGILKGSGGLISPS